MADRFLTFHTLLDMCESRGYDPDGAAFEDRLKYNGLPGYTHFGRDGKAIWCLAWNKMVDYEYAAPDTGTTHPAILFSSGREEYFKKGMLWRDDGPAVITSKGTRKFFVRNEEVPHTATTPLPEMDARGLTCPGSVAAHHAILERRKCANASGVEPETSDSDDIFDALGVGSVSEPAPTAVQPVVVCLTGSSYTPTEDDFLQDDERAVVGIEQAVYTWDRQWSDVSRREKLRALVEKRLEYQDNKAEKASLVRFFTMYFPPRSGAATRAAPKAGVGKATGRRPRPKARIPRR